MGDHSETIQIDYDPTVLSYEELLDVFWDSHTPVSRSVSRQYGSVVFYHDEEQRNVATSAKERRETQSGRQITTEIVPYSEFWLAEDYHQKYRLRGVDDLMAEFEATYPDSRQFVDSTAAARVNGYLGGHGTLTQLQEEIESLGLSPQGRNRLEELVRRRIE